MNDTNVGFLLDGFQRRVEGVSHVIAVSADGLLVAKTQDLPRDQAETLAAVAAGMTSLLDGANRNFNGGGVLVNVTELVNGWLVSMSINHGGSLLVMAAKSCDIGAVSYELTELINKVGAALTPGERGLAGAAAGWSRP